MTKFASDEAFLDAWEKEINIGVDRGKLTRRDGHADLKSIPMIPEDHADLVKKHGKQ
jgi:hypothetical protein